MATRKVFLDVGGHLGQTIEAILPDCPFDVVYSFEPSEEARKVLGQVAARDDRIVVCPFGLWDRDESLTLHGTGGMGASVVNDAKSGPTETVELRKAGTWMDENIENGDQVFLKLNCEGAELNIIKELRATGWLNRIHALMLDIDARKYDTTKAEALALEQEFRDNKNPLFSLCEDVMIGRTHADRIMNWLHYAGAWDVEPVGPVTQSARKLWYSEWMRVYAGVRWGKMAFARRTLQRFPRVRRAVQRLRGSPLAKYLPTG